MICIYCGAETGDDYDEHEECLERSLSEILDEKEAAMEAGERKWRIDPATGDVVMKLADLRELVFVAAGAATAPLLQDHPTYEFPSERVSEGVEHVLDEWGLVSERDAAR